MSRPDLLLVAALLHDIGKGYPGDHSLVGVDLVERIMPRMGFSAEDTAIVVSLVEYHLLLPETATRRDLSDPRTAMNVAEAVEDLVRLELMHALVEADSLAHRALGLVVVEAAARRRARRRGQPPLPGRAAEAHPAVGPAGPPRRARRRGCASTAGCTSSTSSSAS